MTSTINCPACDHPGCPTFEHPAFGAQWVATDCPDCGIVNRDVRTGRLYRWLDNGLRERVRVRVQAKAKVTT